MFAQKKKLWIIIGQVDQVDPIIRTAVRLK